MLVSQISSIIFVLLCQSIIKMPPQTTNNNDVTNSDSNGNDGNKDNNDDNKKDTIPSVLKINLKEEYPFDENLFLESWKEAFPSSSHPLYQYNAKEDPETALSVIHDAFAFCANWLPRNVIRQLISFPYDPKGPCSILIQGLPVGENVPPTPMKNKIHIHSPSEDSGDGYKAWANTSTHVPVAESLLLGIGRFLGTLQSPPWNHGGERGGLINDMLPVYQGNFNEMNDLRMHRDFPRQLQVETLPFEPEIFILFGVRGDPQHQAKTVVCDSAKLIERMDPHDRHLLETYHIQCQKQLSPDQEPTDYGVPFCIIEKETGVVTLLDYPHKKLSCPEGGNAVLEAYDRLEQLAWDCGERIDLQQGDMLIINNCRLVHGRTAYNPQMNGTDRWLLKCYINHQLWGRPGTSGQKGMVDYPIMDTTAKSS